MNAKYWLNGHACSQVPPNNRALLYGDGVFRTMLASQGDIHQRARQLSKISHDAQVIGLCLPPAEGLGANLETAAQAFEQAILRLTIVAGDSPRGYARGEQAAHWLLQASALPMTHAPAAEQSIRLQALDWRLAAQPALAGIKHLNRLDQVMARRQLAADFDEGLVCDQSGAWVSGVMSNLFWYADGRWHTPALLDCGVAGMCRDWVIDFLAESKAPVRLAKRCSSEDLHQAECVFMCNSVKGLVAVRSWTDPNKQETHWPMPEQRRFTPFNRLLQAFKHPLNHG